MSMEKSLFIHRARVCVCVLEIIQGDQNVVVTVEIVRFLTRKLVDSTVNYFTLVTGRDFYCQKPNCLNVLKLAELNRPQLIAQIKFSLHNS